MTNRPAFCIMGTVLKEVNTLAVRELRVFEDPALQKPCREVTEVNDHVRLLLQDLADTMKKFGGTCIAGNQVGVMRRLIVVDTGSGPVKLVNPVIAEQSGEQEYQETCLSFKDIHAIMLRPEKILIYAMDENGEPVGITAEGDEVKHYCHAMDLLDGRIFIKHVFRFVDMPLEDE